MAEGLQSGLAAPGTSHHHPKESLNSVFGTSPKPLSTMGSDPFRQKRLENTTRQTCECLKLVLKEFFREEKKKKP